MANGGNVSAGGGGIGFCGLLGILFIALKLTNYIDWPWWVVLAPIWAPMALVLVVFLLLVLAKAASN